MSYDFYSLFYQEEHRWASIDANAPPEHRFAGANARVPEDVHSILDVGSGNGEFLKSLPDRYFKVGIDISPEPDSRTSGDSLVASIEFLPFAAHSFDLVTCFEVLEHIPYAVFPKALCELERVSRRYIIISVPNREILGQALVSCPQCFCAFNPARHVRSLDECLLQSLFSQFQPVEIKTCGPVVFRHDSKLIKLYRALFPRRSPSHAVCPQCGYAATLQESHKSPATPDSGSRLPVQSISYFIRRVVIRTRRTPYWLLATYKRVGV